MSETARVVMGISVGASGVACEVESIDTTLDSAAARTQSVLLADHTTFHIGGPAKRLVVATTEAEIVDAVTSADAAGEPVLVLSGGSNVLISDAGFDGTVVKIATRGVHADVSNCGGGLVRVEAGESWDSFVDYAIGQEWIGVEALSGIPGLVGSTAIQNVGAYGSEVSDTIASVRTLDRNTGRFATFPLVECRFGYRDSRFKQEPERYVVLQVSFQFELGTLSAPIRYAQLARALGVEPGARVDTRRVRDAVIALRRSKGMVLDEADHDTWSAGSFFTNPILSVAEADALPPEAPRFPQPDGRIKSSAAWLIDHAGFHKGFGTPPATLSTKHALALTNRGGASADDIVALARQVRAGVLAAYGIDLVPEPVLVGLSL